MQRWMRLSPEGTSADQTSETAARNATGRANHFMSTGYATGREGWVGRRAMRVVRELLGFLPAAPGTLKSIAESGDLVPGFFGISRGMCKSHILHLFRQRNIPALPDPTL